MSLKDKLNGGEMTLKQEIENLCLKKLGRLPDIDNPQGYNDKIQWLKLYDQSQDQVTCVDKLAVRDWVAQRDKDCLIPLTDSFPAIWKCTHNSGGAIVVGDSSQATGAYNRLSKQLARLYGSGKGEWAYLYVKPQIIKETVLSDNTDYKFHCVNGKVRWIQIIWGRQNAKPYECIMAADWKPTGVQMDEKMLKANFTTLPPENARKRLISLAETLAQGWKYVRVDLYWSDNKAWFGELTFWPRAGCYKNDSDHLFGTLMNFSLDKKRPIVE